MKREAQLLYGQAAYDDLVARAVAAEREAKELREAGQAAVEAGFREVVGYVACAACIAEDGPGFKDILPYAGHDEDCPLRPFEELRAALGRGTAQKTIGMGSDG